MFCLWFGLFSNAQDSYNQVQSGSENKGSWTHEVRLVIAGQTSVAVPGEVALLILFDSHSFRIFVFL